MLPQRGEGVNRKYINFPPACVCTAAGEGGAGQSFAASMQAVAVLQQQSARAALLLS